jgi:hypothetical protein
MNVERIKQIFLEFVRALPEQGMPNSGPAAGPQLLTGPVLVRGNLIMRDELALGYLDTLEKMHALATVDGSWNKDAVDDLLAKHVLAVAKVAIDQRSTVIPEQGKELAERLKESLQTWQIDLSVFGAGFDLNGLVFGRLSFVADNIRTPVAVPGFIESNIDTAFLLAGLSVQAINRKSALEKAREIVEQHLDVLNALCADLIPSRTYLFHTGTPVRRFGLSRSAASTENEPEIQLHTENYVVLLSRADCDAFLRRRGGSRVSELLLASNSFAKRITSAFETAGEACVELKPHRAFLLFAIALESVVLGRETQSEITYQLSARVAHLLAPDLASRRAVAKAVNELYRVRSKIVHTGETDVSQAELESIQQLCLSTLYALVVLKPFAEMKGVDELEQWFRDRMLGAVETGD